MAITAALRKNSGGFYSPMFKDLKMMDDQIIIYDKSITKSKNGGKGMAANKNTQKRSLKGILDNVLAYIDNL